MNVVALLKDLTPPILQRAIPAPVRAALSRWLGRAPSPLPRDQYYDATVEETARFAEVAPIISQSPAGVLSLIRAIEYVIANGIPGAFVECGVFKGGSAMVIARTLTRLGVADREIWLYDTFAGMPKPGVEDVSHDGRSELPVWEMKREGDWEGGSNNTRAPLEDVRERVLGCGYPAGRFHFVKGVVEETIPANSPQQIAILRLDTDYYSSTRHEMMHLFPRLNKYGVLIVDDYGYFRGARQAVDEYLSALKTPLLLTRCDASVRVAVKSAD